MISYMISCSATFQMRLARTRRRDSDGWLRRDSEAMGVLAGPPLRITMFLPPSWWRGDTPAAAAGRQARLGLGRCIRVGPDHEPKADSDETKDSDDSDETKADSENLKPKADSDEPPFPTPAQPPSESVVDVYHDNLIWWLVSIIWYSGWCL